jgi:hypothetical protein
MSRGSITFQYVSDLHLEFRGFEVNKIIESIIPAAPYLVLAGDIGKPSHPNYTFFLAAMSKRFEYVFLVAGNHEFYGSSVPEALAAITKICDGFPNVYFLNSELFVDASLPIHIFGGTMWTLVKSEERHGVEILMNDSRLIREFTVDSAATEHMRFVERLQVSLDANTDKPFLVISHHLPSFELIDPKYSGSSINSAFATNVPMAHDERIKAWVYGHTHSSRPGPRFYCNPIGYPGENLSVTYNALLTIPLEEQRVQSDSEQE